MRQPKTCVKTCERCSQVFAKRSNVTRTAWSRRRYCSQACRLSAVRVQTEAKPCLGCGKEMTRIASGRRKICTRNWAMKKFCSAACRSRAYIHQLQTPEVREKAAATLRGRPMREEVRVRMRGRTKSEEHCAAISKALKGKLAGPKHPNWKGGVSEARHNARVFDMGRRLYRRWRRAVLRRDKFTCQHCGTPRGNGRLHSHHIRPYAEHPELRYDVSNGITLCRACHTAAHRQLRAG